jgi:hypothetical protein
MGDAPWCMRCSWPVALCRCKRPSVRVMEVCETGEERCGWPMLVADQHGRVDMRLGAIVFDLVWVSLEHEPQQGPLDAEAEALSRHEPLSGCSAPIPRAP